MRSLRAWTGVRHRCRQRQRRRCKHPGTQQHLQPARGQVSDTGADKGRDADAGRSTQKHLQQAHSSICSKHTAASAASAPPGAAIWPLGANVGAIIGPGPGAGAMTRALAAREMLTKMQQTRPIAAARDAPETAIGLDLAPTAGTALTRPQQMDLKWGTELCCQLADTWQHAEHVTACNSAGSFDLALTLPRGSAGVLCPFAAEGAHTW